MPSVSIERFGGPDVIQIRELARRKPGAGEIAVSTRAAGVGPWDAWVRAGRSAVVTSARLPLVLGAEFAGVVDCVGPGVEGIAAGDDVFGVSNATFIGAHAGYVIAEAGRVALRPRQLDAVEAASMPVGAVTAWQLVMEHSPALAGLTVLVLSASGTVGRFAVALARNAGARVLATTSASQVRAVRQLGAQQCIDAEGLGLDDWDGRIDVVLDLAGGAVQRRALRSLRAGGSLVSIVQPVDPSAARAAGVAASFFIVDVTTARLQSAVASLLALQVGAVVGVVLPLSAAAKAHEMLEGLQPRPRGKIVLDPEA